MTRESRFERIERARDEKDSKAPSHEAPTPETASRFVPVDEPMAPAAERSGPSEPDPLRPVPPPLARFEEDGAAGIRFESGELADLPMLRCGACRRDSSKFDKTCIYCGASLESPEAVAVNRQWLQELRAQRAAEQEALAEQHREAIRQTVLGGQLTQREREQLAADVREPIPPLVRAGLILAAFAALAGAIAIVPYGGKCVLFVVFVALLAVGVPPPVWRAVGRLQRPRGD